jgi:hypothetical protein
LSRLNQSTTLQWTLCWAVWISPQHYSWHYIEPSESFHNITLDTLLSRLNQSTTLQWTLCWAVWISPQHDSGHCWAVWISPQHYSGHFVEPSESVHNITVDTMLNNLSHSTPLKWTVCWTVSINPRQLCRSPSPNLKMEAIHCSEFPPTLHKIQQPAPFPFELPISHPRVCIFPLRWMTEFNTHTQQLVICYNFIYFNGFLYTTREMTSSV